METKTTQTTKKDLKRAEELMRIYAQCEANLKSLQATIANEIKAYRENMAEAQTELLAIGERNKEQFNEEANLVFEDGYLHIAAKAVVETTKKFSWADFMEQKSALVKIDFETAKVKKAWLDADQHNELIELGVQVNTNHEMQVITNKKY
jgi:hypothetical protein